MHVYVNNAKTTLAAGLNTGVTTMTVDDASMLPSLGDGEVIPMTLTHSTLPDTYEVVLVTDVSGAPDLVVQRSYESDQQDWPTGTDVKANITAGMLGVFLQQDASGVIPAPSGNAMILGNSKANATTSGSDSTVINARSRLANAVQVAGYPTLQLTSSAGGSKNDLNFSREHVGGTQPVDLGTASTWSEIDYRRGSVVIPSTPDGYQYWLDINDINDDVSNDTGEPAFDGPSGGVASAAGWWFPTELPVDILSVHVPGLVVTEVGFICQKYSASAVPSISIGTESDATRYANAVALTGIGAGKIHRIPITASGAIQETDALRFQVTTPASGGRCLGRFYWKGFFVELESAL